MGQEGKGKAKCGDSEDCVLNFGCSSYGLGFSFVIIITFYYCYYYYCFFHLKDNFFTMLC